MKKVVIPNRKYTDGPKKMVSMRMPEKLWKKIEHLAQKKGWPVTDLITTVLDQIVQDEEN